MSAPAPGSSRRAVRLRLLGLFATVTAVAVVVLVGLALNARAVADFADGDGASTVPLVLAAVAALTPALVSAGLLSAAAGYALGLAAGFPVALAGLSVGTLLAVAAVRLVGARGAAEALGDRVARLAAWLERRPFRSVLFARLAPGMPFAQTSYACGLTSISATTILAATAVGFAPRCFVYTALGGSIRDLGSTEARVAIVATAAIAVAALVLPRLFPAFDVNRQTKEPRYRWTT